jgi:hypothetical protein
MIEKPFYDSKNGNAYKKNSSEERNATKYIITSLAMIAIVATLASAGNAMFKSATLDASNTQLGSIMACEENALRYEQLGYYTGGAAQFNAVITACTSSSNSEDGISEAT